MLIPFDLYYATKSAHYHGNNWFLYEGGTLSNHHYHQQVYSKIVFIKDPVQEIDPDLDSQNAALDPPTLK
ncbi:MAG: hypothetical protein EOP45_17360 [Sphingobacteriaceae bacterium]|nr:MAG: hypothetical protein EOP45_17360 [Sphingobacteriaceae bacterium]